jgi:predicted ATP-dependent serine protease
MLGLLGSAGRMKRKMGQRPCERCGLLYNPKKKGKCPHCGDLDEQELERLLTRLDRQHKAHRQLGVWFAGGAVVIVLVLILVNAG